MDDSLQSEVLQQELDQVRADLARTELEGREDLARRDASGDFHRHKAEESAEGLSSALAEIEALQRQLSKERRIRKTVSKDAALVEIEVRHLQADLERERNVSATLREGVAALELERSVAEAKERTTHVPALPDTSAMELKMEHDATSARVSHLAGELEVSELTREALAHDLTKTQQELVSARKELQALAEKMQDGEIDRSHLAAALEEKKNEAHDASSAVVRTRRELTNLSAEKDAVSNNLEAKVAAKDEDISRLRKELAQMVDNMALEEADWTIALNKEKATHEDLEMEVEDLTTTIASQKAVLQQTKKLVGEHMDKIEQLASALEELNSINDALSADKDALKHELMEVRGELEDETLRMDLVKEEKNKAKQAFDHTQGLYDRLVVEKDILVKHLMDLKASEAKVVDALAEMQSVHAADTAHIAIQADALNHEIHLRNEVEGQRDDALQRLHVLHEAHDAVIIERDLLSAELARTQAELMAKADALAVTSSELESVRKELHVTLADLAAEKSDTHVLRDRLGHIEVELAAHTQRQQELDKALLDMSVDSTSAQENFERVRDELVRADQEKKNATRNVQTLREEKTRMESTLRSLRLDAESGKTALLRMTASRDRLSEDLIAARGTIAKLTNQVNKQSMDEDSSDRSLRQEMSKVKSLEARLAQSTGINAKLREDWRALARERGELEVGRLKGEQRIAEAERARLMAEARLKQSCSSQSTEALQLQEKLASLERRHKADLSQLRKVNAAVQYDLDQESKRSEQAETRAARSQEEAVAGVSAQIKLLEDELEKERKAKQCFEEKLLEEEAELKCARVKITDLESRLATAG